jgi:hypothetical protein
MASPSVARLVAAPPKYIRLPAGASGYSIEISRDVLRRLLNEINTAGAFGSETGGLLLGSWESVSRGTIRVDDFEVISLDPGDGTVYMLSPQQQDQFAAARQQASAGELAPLGFFRSHGRSGPLALSLADKGLLAKQFRSGAYLALLIETTEPHKMALFLSAEGQAALHSALPNLPALLSEQALPELLRNEPILPPATLYHRPERSELRSDETKLKRRLNSDLLFFCAALCFAVGIVVWPVWESTFGGPWAVAASADMALSIQRHGQNLSLTWNRTMPEIGRAQGGTLTVTDGPQHTELPLNKEDLKFGTVAYVPTSQAVNVTLALQMQDSTSLLQSVQWHK